MPLVDGDGGIYCFIKSEGEYITSYISQGKEITRGIN
jgi:hypothetical protein